MTATAFWAWFDANRAPIDPRPATPGILYEIDDDQIAALLDELDDRLQAYCEGLTFALDAHAEPVIVITAKGHRAYFDQVRALVSCAPPLGPWTVQAFLQPGDPSLYNFERYGCFTVTAHDIACCLFEYCLPDGPPHAVAVFVPYIEASEAEQHVPHVQGMLMMILGEERYAETIGVLNVAPLDSLDDELRDYTMALPALPAALDKATMVHERFMKKRTPNQKI